jgi:hypothetical protein
MLYYQMETYELQDYTEMFSYLTRHKGISLKLYISEVNNIAVVNLEDYLVDLIMSLVFV